MDKGARNEIDLGLSRMERLMEELGHPEEGVKFIHVAGTNGKGSTCVFLASILKEAGFRVGLYMSPAVVDPLEIISVNGENISRESYDRLFNRAVLAGERLEKEGTFLPTIFEIQTAVAFLYFKETGCDISVIETGLGGDLDATNVAHNKLAAVITPIGMDHAALLGPTLSHIAAHKSGIITEGVPVFTARQEDEVMKVLESRAYATGSRVYEMRKITSKTLCEYGCYKFSMENYPKLRSGLSGSYQVDNAALAVTVLDGLRREAEQLKSITEELSVKQLKNDDEPVSNGLESIDDKTWREAVCRGIRNVRIPCRMEIMDERPTFVLDGAHNPAAAGALRESLEEAYPNVPKIFVMGAFKDKDYLEVARTVIHDEICVLTIPAAGERSEHPETLLKGLKAVTEHTGRAYKSIPEALEAARDEAKKYHSAHDVWPIVICFGSLSWLAEARQILKNKEI